VRRREGDLRAGSSVITLRPGPASDELRRSFGAGLCLMQRASSIVDLTATALQIDWPASEQLADCRGDESWDGLGRLVWRQSPFSHAVGERVFRPTVAAQWLSALEEAPRWSQARSPFYSAEATAIDARWGGPTLRHLLDGAGLRRAGEAASALFGAPLVMHGPVVAHRMTADHGIGVHSDAPALGEETHRILVFLARSPRLADGGHFLLLDEAAADRTRKVVPLVHNSGLAFALHDRSYHAVTRLAADCQFSLILSFRPAPACRD